jgi:uncharacterized membrane protein (DUF2068 family)
MLATVALFAAGIVLRIALYFPLAMYQIDSDAIIAGLCAFRVGEGRFPAFLPGGTRVGSASCYVTAGYIHLLGSGRTALALTSLTWGILYLLFTLFFLQAVLGRKRACAGFLFAVVPSEQFMTVTYAPWGYGEIMASCAATLWLAALWRGRADFWCRFWFGTGVGLGLWCSLESLMIALPAVVWIALKRRVSTFYEALPAVIGAVIGFAPFLVWNVSHGFPSFISNWASRPAGTLAQIWSNFLWLWSDLIPKLLFHAGGWWPASVILIAGFVLLAVGFVCALRHADVTGAQLRTGDLATLLGLVLAACVFFFAVSEAGTIRGWTVRYIAPLYVVLPLFGAIGALGLWQATRWTRWLAAAAVAAFLLPNIFLYGLPGSTQRTDLTNRLRDDENLRAVLAQRQVRMVYGNYAWVYHLNFDTGERIAGVPFYAPYDYYDYGSSLGTAPVRWALLGGTDEVAGWARRLRAHGKLVPDGDLLAFIADRPAPNAAQLLATLRSVQQ